jgi:hypothetical protein
MVNNGKDFCVLINSRAEAESVQRWAYDNGYRWISKKHATTENREYHYFGEKGYVILRYNSKTMTTLLGSGLPSWATDGSARSIGDVLNFRQFLCQTVYWDE